MEDDRKDQIRLLSRRNTFQRSVKKIRPLLTDVMKESDYEILELESMDKVIEIHPFRYPDWDINLIRDFNKVDKDLISTTLISMLANINIAIIYFKTHGIGIETQTRILINNWNKMLSIDQGLIVFDPNSERAMKIEKYRDLIEFNVTENGWKLQ